VDPVLEPFLASPDERSSEQQLGDLLARDAAPLIRRVVSSRLGSACGDIEDVCSQLVLQLMLRLRQQRADPNLAGIDAFASYVASAAHHACDHYVRAKYPLRWRLRNRIRYVLEHDARFGVWKAADGSWVCGRAGWRSRPPRDTALSSALFSGVQRQDVRELLSRLCQVCDAPIALSAVVELASSCWDVPLIQQDDARDVDLVADREPRADARLEQRASLERVWSQIHELPVRQRHAVLLTLRDDAIALFVTAGVVSLRGIAAALELPADELARLWNDLPLPDNTVADRLGCSRQQVINLRMAARKRLANRLASAS
jgi:RNA polymerase sigma factor (sigma-70 family)